MGKKKPKSIRPAKKHLPALSLKQFLVTGFSLPWLEQYARYILLVIVSVGFVLRVVDVGGLSLSDDELWNALSAKNILQGKPVVSTDALPQTYAVATSFEVFGVNETAGRLPGVLFGTIAIVLVYFVARRLFNPEIGLFAALLLSLSTHSLVFSRSARNYGFFQMAYLLLVYLFLRGFEGTRQSLTKQAASLVPKARRFLATQGIELKYLVLFGIAGVLSLFIHPLTVFFFFSIIAYCLLLSIYGIMKKGSGIWQSKYVIASSGLIALGILLAVIATQTSLLSVAFYGSNMIARITPKWNLIAQEFLTEKLKVFSVYFDMLHNDFPVLWLLGIVGLCGAFWLGEKQVGSYLVSMFVFPFLLQSFVFVDPYAPRYIVHIYPLYLIAIAVGFYILVRLFLFVVTRLRLTRYVGFGYALIVLAFLLGFPYKQIAQIPSLPYGECPLPNESLIFYNWRSACHYVKDHMRGSDIIWATMSNATEFYMNRSSLWLLRAALNGKDKTIAFRDTVDSYPRGWVIADARLNIVNQDVKDAVMLNMKYHYDASSPDISIFSWDNSSPPEPQKAFFLQFSEEQVERAEWQVEQRARYQAGVIRVILDCEAIDSPNEAQCIVNGYVISIPPGSSNNREQIQFQVPAVYFREGQNSVSFRYTPSHDEKRKGYALYGFEVR